MSHNYVFKAERDTMRTCVAQLDGCLQQMTQYLREIDFESDVPKATAMMFQARQRLTYAIVLLEHDLQDPSSSRDGQQLSTP